MKEFQYAIRDKIGLHARPAGLLVQKSKTFQSDVFISFNGKKADAKRIFALMGLSIKTEDRITVQISGADEETAEKELEDFMKNNL